MTTALVPIVRTEAGAVFANSRDVADFFGKEHRNVLADCRKLVAFLSAGNSALWFRPATYQAKVGYGLRTLPAFNMTKDGFALLVMGFTGGEALASAGSTRHWERLKRYPKSS